jgi:SAM-dependent methyltransferase
MGTLEELLCEVERHPISGWDFSWLGNRMSIDPSPWDFQKIMVEHTRQSPSLLDIGTGGGEWLASISDLPLRTVATEAWPPNVPVATARLASLGVQVVQVENALDNNLQSEADNSYARLPFPDESFHLISNRHESFIANEVARVLDHGGCFITEQVGDGVYREFRELFGAPLSRTRSLSMELLVHQVEEAGLSIVNSAEDEGQVQFADVGALAWYLLMVPWIVPGFTISGQYQRLAELHERAQSGLSLTAHLPRFYVVAAKA